MSNNRCYDLAAWERGQRAPALYTKWAHHNARGRRDKGIKADKRLLPRKRKHRVRVNHHLEGRLVGRPLTASELAYVKALQA